MTTGAITALVSSMGEFVSGATSWMGDIVTFITSNPLVFVFVAGLPVVGLGIGLIRRLIG